MGGQVVVFGGFQPHRPPRAVTGRKYCDLLIKVRKKNRRAARPPKHLARSLAPDPIIHFPSLMRQFLFKGALKPFGSIVKCMSPRSSHCFLNAYQDDEKNSSFSSCHSSKSKSESPPPDSPNFSNLAELVSAAVALS